MEVLSLEFLSAALALDNILMLRIISLEGRKLHKALQTQYLVNHNSLIIQKVFKPGCLKQTLSKKVYNRKGK